MAGSLLKDQRRLARQKFFLRNFYKRAVLSLPAAERRRDSEKIAARLAAHDDFRRAETVALYVALPHEADMRPVIALCRRQEKRVVLPVVDPVTGALRFQPLSGDGKALRKNVYGIPEPAARPDAAVAMGEIDLVVVPGRAFTPEGVRLGAGGGYYDRLFTRHPRAKRLGVAFDVQLAWRLPSAEGDVSVEAVLTPRRLYKRP